MPRNGKRGSMSDEDMALLLMPKGGESDGDEYDDGPNEEFLDEASVAFPDMSDEQLSALYAAIKACK